MLIGGLQKTTLVDYPGKVAATIFTIGCPFRCSYCHNPDIVKGIARVISTERILKFLKERKKFLDAVCLTGGEPIIQAGILTFLKKIKEMGYSVKLDTNGINPKKLKRLMELNLIDYIAMDIKAPWEKYFSIVCRKTDLTAVQESVNIIREGNVDYEFRSTVLPALHSPEDIIEMACQISGAKRYFIQRFQSRDKLMNNNFINAEGYTMKELKEIIGKIKDGFEVCKIRG